MTKSKFVFVLTSLTLIFSIIGSFLFQDNVVAKNTSVHVHVKGDTANISSVSIEHLDSTIVLETKNKKLYSIKKPADIVKPDISKIIVTFNDGSTHVYSPAINYAGVEGNGTINYWIEVADKVDQSVTKAKSIKQEIDKDSVKAKKTNEIKKDKSNGNKTTIEVEKNRTTTAVKDNSQSTTNITTKIETKEENKSTITAGVATSSTAKTSDSQGLVQVNDSQSTSKDSVNDETIGIHNASSKVEQTETNENNSPTATISGGELPDTASVWYNLLVIGGILLIVSILVILKLKLSR
ncbi:hypothetical protein [Bacillus sp. Marseille-P3661]|uniref:hypothetical protein n=1 Tax=Bacillus sp. Marseille-P3661 TaxID=1936234 RepID=UPI000C846E99|nr:hypothetical protein [Bacillus sp. Marseille-P3661]